MSFGTIQLDSNERDCMALLATGTTNPSRYENIRHKALLRTAGLSANNTRQAVDEVFRGMAALWPNAKNEKELDQIKKDALSGKLSPYEIVGKVKDSLKAAGMPSKRYRSEAMTKHWTQLSIALALQPTAKPILPADFDLEAELANKVVLPKAEALMKSLDEKIPGKFHESRPYLKAATANQPNWPEILGNLPKGSRRAALELLKGSKESPRFAEAGQALAWPEIEGPAEAENFRLNSLLHSLPAIAHGRKTLAMKTAASMKAPPQSVELPSTEMSWRHRSKERTTLDKIAASTDRGMLSSKLGEIMKLYMHFHPDSYPKILEAAKKRHAEIPDRAGITYDGILEDLEFTLNPKSTAIPKTQTKGDDEVKNLTELKRLANSLKEDDPFGVNAMAGNKLAVILRRPLPEAAREIVRELAPSMTAAAYWLARKIDRKPSLTSAGKESESMAKEPDTMPRRAKVEQVWDDDDILSKVEHSKPEPEEPFEDSIPSDPKATGSFTDLIISATEGEPLPLEKSYGRNRYTLMHVATKFRSDGVMEETILAAKEQKTPVFPPDSKGNNPAFTCKSSETAQLAIQYHAPIHTPNGKGQTAFDSNPWIRMAQQQRERELAAAKKMKDTTILEI